MKLDKIIAVRTGKTIYKDEDKAVKVFDSDYSKADIFERGSQSGAYRGDRS